MIDDPTVTVEQGSCIVNEIWPVTRGEHCFVYQGDMRSKYAEILCTGWSDTGISVAICAGPRTLYATGSDRSTDVTFAFPADGWRCVAELSRYTLTVVLFQYPDEFDIGNPQYVYTRNEEDNVDRP